MPPKNIELSGGTLYWSDGNIHIDEGLVEVIENEPIEPIIIPPRSAEINLTATIDYRTWLSLLLGKRVTNNWLKMHGGVMRRGRWRK